MQIWSQFSRAFLTMFGLDYQRETSRIPSFSRWLTPFYWSIDLIKSSFLLLTIKRSPKIAGLWFTWLMLSRTSWTQISRTGLITQIISAGVLICAGSELRSETIRKQGGTSCSPEGSLDTRKWQAKRKSTWKSIQRILNPKKLRESWYKRNP